MSSNLLLNTGPPDAILLNTGFNLLLNGEDPLLLKAGGRWFGTSLQTKPTLTLDQTGHEFYETDTQLKFIWSGVLWERQR